jgi:hypothetical protein
MIGPNMTKIGFTGTQDGMTLTQKSTLRDLLDGGSGEFHHGDCIGADSEAHDIAILCGYTVVLHPPRNPAKRAWHDVPQHLMRAKKAYLARNKDIVTETASLIAARADPCRATAVRNVVDRSLCATAGKAGFPDPAGRDCDTMRWSRGEQRTK